MFKQNEMDLHRMKKKLEIWNPFEYAWHGIFVYGIPISMKL